MSQDVWNTIDPFNTNGEELVEILTQFKDAVISGMSGPAQPTEIEPGGTWVDTSDEAGPNYLWTLKMWTGDINISLFTININSGLVSIPGSLAIPAIEFGSQEITGGVDFPTLNADKLVVLLKDATPTPAPSNVFGIDPSGETKAIYIHNKMTESMIIVNESASAGGATHRISCPGGEDIEVEPLQTIALFYDTVATRWKLLSGAGAGGTNVPAGVATLATTDTEVVVTFAEDMDDINYSIQHTFENLVDAEPTFMMGFVSAKSVSGFTMKFNIAIDSNNYKFNWAAVPF